MMTQPAVSPFRVVERDAAGKRAVINAGFAVTFKYRPGHDEMFESLTHPAVFRTAERAQLFADKVWKSASKINTSNWSYNGGICSPMGSNVLPPYSVL
jgi:hypothetical protein